jgi:hypothetical protein
MVKNMNKTIEGDTFQAGYDILKKYAFTLKGIPGISCEIGVRRGLGSKSIMEGLLENNDKRPHICVDPYGMILMLNDNFYGGSVKGDYTNKMKLECISALCEWAYINDINISFYTLEDTEFYNRFSDGIPIYDDNKQIINKYCYVHVDGPHTYKAVENACIFFLKKMDAGSIIAFDNCDHYDHNKIERLYLSPYNFYFMEEYDSSHRRIYKQKI